MLDLMLIGCVMEQFNIESLLIQHCGPTGKKPLPTITPVDQVGEDKSLLWEAEDP